MDKIQTELDLEERLNRGQITTQRVLKVELLGVYDEVCGEYGREEFQNLVLPTLMRVYKRDYSAAGLTALALIGYVSYIPATQTGKYLRSWTEQMEEKIGKGYVSPKNNSEEISDMVTYMDTSNPTKDGIGIIKEMIGLDIKNLIIEQWGTQKILAEYYYRELGFGAVNSAKQYICHICNGYLANSSNSHKSSEKNLRRLSILLSILDVNENDTLISAITKLYPTFQYKIFAAQKF